jgi:formylglycine-generating enzyme required for sulfatase activity
MARIEKTVFISYRRTDVYTALAVYENLKNQGYDVFFDYRSISSGDFEQIITSNIRARAHFILILTPTALDRCNEPGDWLRREIEFAIDQKRNIIPLFFRGFRFGEPALSEKLTGKLQNLSRYNGLNVHEDYFEEAMHRLRTQYLNIPLNTVIHPVSTEVSKVVREEQIAADKALEQIEDVHELVKKDHEPPVQPKAVPASRQNKSAPSTVGVVPQGEKKADKAEVLAPKVLSRPKRAIQNEAQDIAVPRAVKESPISGHVFKFRLIGWITGAVSLLALLIWGGVNIFQNPPSNTPDSTLNSRVVETQTSRPLETNTPSLIRTPTLASTRLSQPVITITPSPTPIPDIGSTMTGTDGMTLLYVPPGEFIMGSYSGSADEQPVHRPNLDAFWIDQTEVTNVMFADFLNEQENQIEGGVTWLDAGAGNARIHLVGNVWQSDSQYKNHPVTLVTWYGAKAYCQWAGRRLPTDAEWEKAARGPDANTYPWGHEAPNANLVNYNGNVGGTTDVGKYPNDKSIYGALDMAGNVEEWVSSLYKPYPYDAADGRENLDSSDDRVVRGNSWVQYIMLHDRPSYWRVNSPSTNTTESLGFRCAMDANP